MRIPLLVFTLVGSSLVSRGVAAQVPVPPFDPPTLAAPTHYVNISAPTATDVANPYGTPARPRRSVPPVLPAGAVVEVRGGPYNIGGAQGTITAQGTAAQPAAVTCVEGSVVQGTYGARLTLAGSYGVWEGCVFDNTAVTIPGDHWVFRKNEVRHHSPPGNSSALSTSGSFVVLRENWVHHNGDAQSPKEIDVHGMLVIPGASNIWILDSTAHHNGGDALQIGQAQSAEPWASRVFVSGNVFHEDRENAIDVKKSRDVLLVRNILYGYRETSSSAGEVIVTHDGAERVWVVANVVALGVRGIVSTNAQGYVVLGNLILGIRHNPNAPYDPASRYGSFGILTRDSANVHHWHNTIVESDGGVSLVSNSGAQVVGNTIALVTHQALNAPGAVLQTNWLTGDPQFVNPAAADFRLLPTSPLKGAGTPTVLWDVYAFLYQTPPLRDVYEQVRVPPPSIGAAQ